MTKKYPTKREYEHDDKISQRNYFVWYHKIVTNYNFGGNSEKAKQFEIDVGKIYINNGINRALKFAKYKIKQTPKWKELMDFYNSRPKNLVDKIKHSC